MSDPDMPRVAVIGGGWAGCAAAVELAHAGVRVALFEQSRTLGGRARRVTLSGLSLDNGQHLLIGAYRRTLEAIGRVHGAGRMAALFHRLPLTLRPFGVAAANAVSLRARSLPAPLHLLSGILTARGLSWRERAALVASFRRLVHTDFRTPPTQTVAQCFADAPLHVMAAVWEPLCISALNTPPETASAQIFANVLRIAFTGSARNSDFLVPATDLNSLFPDPAARYVERHRGVVHTGITVRAVVPDARGVVLDLGGASETYDAVVLAVGPHQLLTTLGPGAANETAWRGPLSRIEALRWESITTIYLAYREPLHLPLPIMRLDDAPGQWVFDRSAALGAAPPEGAKGLVAVVISTGGPHDTQDQATLATASDEQLRRLAGRWPLPVWSRVISERRATYACTPDARRPTAGRIALGVYLAGDYTDAELPATLEAAIRSGLTAARAFLAGRRGVSDVRVRLPN